MRIRFIAYVAALSFGTVLLSSCADRHEDPSSVGDVGDVGGVGAVDDLDKSLPASPADLAAEPAVGLIALTWTDVSGGDVMSFLVYRSHTQDTGYVKIAAVGEGLSYSDHDVNAGQTYSYVVTAVDSDNAESPRSASASAAPLDTPQVGVLTPPTGLTAQGRVEAVELDWSDHSDSRVEAYAVYRSTVSGAGFAQVASGLGASFFTDPTASSGTTYFYVVTALDAQAEESAASNEVFATPSAQDPQVRPVITVLPSTTSRMAPFAVHVNATGSNLGSGDWHTARFEWNFDATNVEASHLTAQDPRTLQQVDLAQQQQGFNASYLYRTEGTYTIRLVVTNADGEAAIAATTVTVEPDSRVVRYVDSSIGNDGNAGTSELEPWGTLEAAAASAADDMTILFRRGQIFDTGRGVTFGASNVVLAAYGSGEPPLLRMTEERDLVRVDGDNVVLRDLAMTSNTTAPTISGPDAFSPNGDRITLWNVEFKASIGGRPFRELIVGSSSADGLLLIGVDNREAQTRKYVLIPAGTHTVALGCTLRQPVEEALMRSFHGEHMQLAYCDFIQEGGAGKDVLRTQTGRWFCYFRNKIQGGILLSHKRQGAHYMVIDSNLSIEDTGRNQNRFVFKGGTDHVMIRNNVFLASKPYKPLLVGWDDPDPGPNTVDSVEILNNTFIFEVPANPNDILAPNGFWVWSDIRISNNLFAVHPEFGIRERQLINTTTATDTLSEAKFNVFPDFGDSYGYAKIGTEQSWAQWQQNSFVDGTTSRETVGIDDLVAPDYTLDPTVFPVTASGAVPHRGVFQDYHGNSRPRGEGAAWSCGAVQFAP